MLPAVLTVRQLSQRSVCLSNLRQAGIAINLYAMDSDGFLPALYETGYNDTWYNRIGPYLEKSGNGLSSGFGADTLRCPVITPPFRSADKVYSHTYGANYPGVLSILGYWGQNGGSRLERVPINVFIIADMGEGVQDNWGSYDYNWRAGIHNPTSMWILDTDYDSDGALDSNLFQITNGVGPYNAFAPVHRSSGNFLFKDGRVQSFSRRDWAINKDGLWGNYGIPAYR